MMATLTASDWDRNKAGILLQRAGFGGTPQEIDALAALSPARAVDSLLGPTKFPPPDPPAFLEESGTEEALKTERAKMNSFQIRPRQTQGEKSPSTIERPKDVR